MSDGIMNIQHLKASSDWLVFSRIKFCSNMNFEMFRKISFLLVSFAALVALEWSFPSVLPHVPLQMARLRANIVALVTFERLFSVVLCHHVNFQITRFSASKVALFAFERLLSCMHPHHVNFQITSSNARIIA